MSRQLLIVLPTYNEARNIVRLIGDLRRLQPQADILVIDDGSPDGTGQAVLDATKPGDPIELIQRGSKQGLGTAHVLGMDRAVAGGYETLVTMDCDYTHRPEDIARLLDVLHNSAVDIAVGSRYGHPEGIADWPVWRRAITQVAHQCTKHLLGIPMDATSAFRAFRVTALKRVRYGEVRGDGYSFMFEMLFAALAAGLNVTAVPCQMPIRQAGESKISRAEVVKAVGALARLSLLRLGSRAGLVRSHHEA